jgi:hypothetical protein
MHKENNVKSTKIIMPAIIQTGCFPKANCTCYHTANQKDREKPGKISLWVFHLLIQFWDL